MSKEPDISKWRELDKEASEEPDITKWRKLEKEAEDTFEYMQKVGLVELKKVAGGKSFRFTPKHEALVGEIKRHLDSVLDKYVKNARTSPDAVCETLAIDEETIGLTINSLDNTHPKNERRYRTLIMAAVYPAAWKKAQELKREIFKIFLEGKGGELDPDLATKYAILAYCMTARRQRCPQLIGTGAIYRRPDLIRKYFEGLEEDNSSINAYIRGLP